MRKLFIIILVIFTFSGCSSSHSYQQSIYRNNEKIAKQGDSYTFAKRIANINDTEMSLEYSGFSGKQVIWQLDAVEDTILNMSVDFVVKSGSFKVCLVDSVSNVLVVSENTCDMNVDLTIPSGENQIVLVGYQASGEVDIAIQGNESLSIRANE